MSAGIQKMSVCVGGVEVGETEGEREIKERRLCILNELDVSMSAIARSIKLPSGALLSVATEHVA